MSEPFRIFVDGVAVEATAGETTIAAIQRWHPHLALQLRDGARTLTDSRGLPISIDSPAYAGAIFRVGSARTARANDATIGTDATNAEDGD